MNFSIVIPFYNNCSNLNILKETLIDYKNDKDVEIIIVNDCSDSNQTEILNCSFLEFNNLKIINNKKNSGPSFSRMAGVQIASGEYIFFLDADDGWSKNKAYYQYNYNKKNKIIISGGPVRSTTAVEFKKDREQYSLNSINIKEISFKDSIFFNPYATTSICVLREKIIDQPFDLNMRYAEDIDCWRRILLSNKGCVYSDSGAFQFKISYLANHTSLSSNLFKMVKGNIYSLNKIAKEYDTSLLIKFLLYISMAFSLIKLVYRVLKRRVINF